ncbi:MFS transporter [Nocardia sp. NPDC052254]|uniref:MFS transporter n=1 Tax=Nocardia sp. NPDC052254 TaxID=3155681 RepID=UPI00342913B6
MFYASMGLSASALSLALLAGGAAGVLGSVAGGWSASRFGPADVLIAGSVLNVPLLSLLATLTDRPIAAVAVASASIAVTQSFSGPAATLVTGSSYTGNTVTVVAFHRIFLSSGVTVAPMAVAVVGQDDFALLFALSALGSLATALLLVSERARLLTAASHAARGVPADGSPPRESPGRHPMRLWAIVVVFGTAMAVYCQSTSAIPLSVQRISADGQLYGALIVLNSIFVIAFELPLSYLTARLRWNIALGLGIALAGTGLAVSGLASGWAVCVTGFVVFSLGEAIFLPQASASIATLAAPADNARYQGYLSAAQSIGFAIGPGVGAFGVLHSPTLYWFVVVGISSIAAAVAFIAGNERKRRAVRIG